MVVCSCNVINDADIRLAVDNLLQHSPKTKLSAANIFEEIGCIHDCCGCVPNLKRIVRETLTQ